MSFAGVQTKRKFASDGTTESPSEESSWESHARSPANTSRVRETYSTSSSGGDARSLGDRGDWPRLPRPANPLDELGVSADQISQPQPSHSVKLGERGEHGHMARTRGACGHAPFAGVGANPRKHSSTTSSAPACSQRQAAASITRGSTRRPVGLFGLQRYATSPGPSIARAKEAGTSKSSASERGTPARMRRSTMPSAYQRTSAHTRRCVSGAPPAASRQMMSAAPAPQTIYLRECPGRALGRERGRGFPYRGRRRFEKAPCKLRRRHAARGLPDSRSPRSQ